MVCYSKTNEVLQCVTSFFNKPEYSDVTVRGPSGKEYFCSKMMMCSQSEVFERMFESRMVETATGDSREVHIQEVDSHALEDMLYFMHTGVCNVTDLNLLPLHAVADQFQVKNLLAVCEEYERDILTVKSENVLILLMDAMVFNRQTWVERCSRFVTRNMAGVYYQDEFQELPVELVKKLVGVLVAEEEELTPEQYFHFAVGLITWISDDQSRGKHFQELFEKVDLSRISRGDVDRLCEMKYVQESPELAMRIVKVLGKSSSRKKDKKDEPFLWATSPYLSRPILSSSWERKDSIHLVLTRDEEV